MTIKRTKVTDGIFVWTETDVDMKDGCGPEEWEAMYQGLVHHSPPGRIANIEKMLPEANGDPANDMRRDHVLRMVEKAKTGNFDLEALREAETTLRELMLVPMVQRDQKRQQGTKKPRRPEIDQWIDRQLERTPDAKSPDLWKAAPDWITDPIAYDRFCKRVTQGRKRRK